jgi:hypothetical protein
MTGGIGFSAVIVWLAVRDQHGTTRFRSFTRISNLVGSIFVDKWLM